MKRLILIAFSCLFVLIGGYFIWWHLPVSINRHSDIKLGNQVIEKIDYYLKLNKKLPNSYDWNTLKNLGIRFYSSELAKPEFNNLNDSIYELVFVEGFDGPYLMWNSSERKWKIGNPAPINIK